MSGHVYYRFKSQKEFQRIIFEGIGISVWDLKREIIQESKMGKGTDFDFAIYNADTDEGMQKKQIHIDLFISLSRPRTDH
jgi:protein MPE1